MQALVAKRSVCDTDRSPLSRVGGSAMGEGDRG
jgi:hypothetical protein